MGQAKGTRFFLGQNVVSRVRFFEYRETAVSKFALYWKADTRRTMPEWRSISGGTDPTAYGGNFGSESFDVAMKAVRMTQTELSAGQGPESRHE